MNQIHDRIRNYLKIGHEMDDEHDPINMVHIQSGKGKYGYKYQSGGYYNKQIGGACSLCGAEGVTKATCPQNPSAKNKKYAEHNQAPVKAVAIKTSPKRNVVQAPIKKIVEQPPAQRQYKKVDTRGCVAQLDDPKYAGRPSPPYPANQCCGEVMRGNDGNMYVSKADKNGTCRWQKQK